MRGSVFIAKKRKWRRRYRYRIVLDKLIGSGILYAAAQTIADKLEMDYLRIGERKRGRDADWVTLRFGRWGNETKAYKSAPFSAELLAGQSAPQSPATTSLAKG